jgi:tripartite-type tricarboxylate transporter receptor subunit TctC
MARIVGIMFDIATIDRSINFPEREARRTSQREDTMIRRIATTLLAGWAMLTPLAALAQAKFPDRPLQIIAPYAPGGAADVLSRFLAKELETRLGQPVIVLNRPGAGTIIGVQALMQAPKDGYTLFISSNSTFTLNPAVMSNLSYDAARDFEPLAQIATANLALVTYADNPAADVKALVAAAKAEPDKLTLASFGTATVSHFAGEWFKSVAGIRMAHVPYRGSGPAMNDLVGKHVPFLIDTIVAARPQIEGGKIRALAVTSAQRSAMLPEVPTLQELGYRGIDLSSWIALVTAKGIPAEAKARLSEALADVLRDPAARASMTKSGFEPVHRVYTDWPREITTEIEAMKAIAKDANIKAD